ncbi:MAG TPA: hypothetical protein VMT97_12620 [Terriglobales bacterium]|nr:hypothetical protein [Terriglobales bacterium]
MRLLQRLIRSCLAGLFLLVAVVEVAWTQATSPAPDSDPGYGLLALVFVIALLVMVGAVVKLYDMKRGGPPAARRQSLPAASDVIRSTPDP